MNIKKRSRKSLASCMLGDPSLLNVNDVNRVLDYQFRSKQLYTRDTLIYNRIYFFIEVHIIYWKRRNTHQ